MAKATKKNKPAISEGEMQPNQPHNLQKLLTFMQKVVSDDENFIFYDDGKQMVLHASAADSLACTAILPSNGKVIEPVAVKRNDFLKAYRNGAKLSGADGKLNMSLGHWRMTLAGAVEGSPPQPVTIEGKKLIADVGPLKSVPTEDNYGDSTWAMFLPEGIAALVSTYSLSAICMKAEVWPRKPVVMQANAILPMVSLVEPQLFVGEDAVGINGKFAMGGGADAEVHIAMAKPAREPPPSEQVLSMLPTKSGRLSVGASELRTCIEGAKKTFDDEATELTFMLTDAGLNISLQSHTAALAECVPYVKRPEKAKGKLVLNTDVLVNCFKGFRELTSSKALAVIRWDENAIWFRITEGDNMIGAIVIPAQGTE